MVLDNIRARCKEQGIPLYEVESQAGLSQNSIFRWNDVMPSADKLARVAQILNTSVEELLN